MSRPLLGYWDISGLAEPIRFVLHYAEVDFEDRRYQYGPQKAAWYEQDRLTLGLDFPNLPYYIDGDLKMTQSLAILRHVARKYGLAGKPEDAALIEMAEQQALDYVTKLATVAYDDKTFEESKVKRLEALPDELDLFTKFIGDKKFVAGDYVTYADFLWYDNLQFHQFFDASKFENRDVIDAYLKRIEQLPNIAKYIASPVYKRQAFSSWAPWPGKKP
ncbi:Glutathione S-transferase [Halotydeus destructor]|nr:Glutathione S-transferase [Halotydeus destructor]